MDTLRVARAGRWCAFAALLSSLAAALLCVVFAAPQRWALVVAIVVAVASGLGGALAVALTPTRRSIGHPHDAEPRTASGDEPVLGIQMQLGHVPDQVARITSAIATTSGPVAMVVPPGRDTPVGLDPSIVVVDAGDTSVDDELLAFYRDCDTVLVTSARAMPTPECRAAASSIDETTSWVQGRCEPLNPDRFGPSEREALDSRLRATASAAGLWCWEPDATIVPAELLAEHPLPVGRPLGSWLRTRAADGHRGRRVENTLTRRAAPVAAEGYWPDTTARQCAAAADVADAIGGPGVSRRGRTVAAALLLRALSGWSVLWWLAALVLLASGSPVQRHGGLLVTLLGATVVLRWLAPRLASGARPSPLHDAVAGLYAMPGSLVATRAALTRRVRPPRRAVSTRPLAWLALLATAAAGTVVVGARPGDDAARIAAGVAAALLVLTWVFTVRSLIEKSWRRVGFRLSLDLPADVIDDELQSGASGWRVVDGGPGGFALLGPSTGRVHGDELSVAVEGTDGSELVLHGTVASVRERGSEVLIGVELRRVEPSTASWAETLADAASRAPVAPVAPVDAHVERSRLGTLVDRLAIGLVLVASVAVAAALVLVLMGLQPLVIRSGSMVPTYHVGDVVLVATEQAEDIEVGDVVTRFDAPQATDSLTHRVRSVRRDGDLVRVETRGDANTGSEVWAVPPGEEVGVVVASIPAIGLPLTAIRSSTGWAVAAAVFVAVVIAILFRPRRARTPAGEDDGLLKTAEQLPTETPTTTVGEPT